MTDSIQQLRNVAIIAHVDHGKTTLVDQLFKQSGMVRDNEEVDERLMDSLDLEKERGITIRSKAGSCEYKGHRINIIDTPGHADFGGEVERVMNMADGALFLVDAVEGPMPQSYFVLKKAVASKLPIIVVVNKIDKPASRVDWVVDQVFDLLVSLDAPDELLDFPIVYASARDGISGMDAEGPMENMMPIFDLIVDKIPHPAGDENGPVQLQVASLSYSSFLGQLAIGKVSSGSVKVNQDVVVASGDEVKSSARITKIYRFKRNEQVEVDSAGLGDIISVAGVSDLLVGDTITDPDQPIGLPPMTVDPPTISMTFVPNDSPFSGQEGEFVTSRHLWDRLEKAALSDVALKVENLGDELGFKVSGRGELHLSILVENMRREGYEFQLSRPSVIFKEDAGKRLEPYEELTIDVDEDVMGKVIEQLGLRKGEMLNMEQENGMARLVYKLPTRGLLGYQSEFMMATKGMGVMNYVFSEYGPYAGEFKTRHNGVLIAKDNCETVAFALFSLQDRGTLFVGPGERVYAGQIIGQNAKDDDMVVNPAKGKKLTNMRASGSDETVVLTPHVTMSLEQYISYIDDSELLEVTPKALRLRKKILSESDRKRLS